MSQLGAYVAAGAALGAVTEATGTTAFTPLGERARADQGGDGGAGPPALPSPGGGVSEDVLAQLAESFQQQQAGTSFDLDLGGLGQQAGSPQTAVALAELRSRLEDQQNRTREWRDRFEERVDETTAGDGDGDGISLPDWLLEEQRDDSSSDDSSSDDSSSDPDDFKLQDLDGRGPFGIGTWLAAGGEIGAEAGDTGSKGVDFATDVGNTYLQGYKALRGEEYSAEDTLAEDIHGTGTRKINWDDHLPWGGDSSSESRTSKNNNEDAKRNRDEPKVVGLNAGTEALWFNKDDDSSSGSSRDEKDPVLSLPDDLEERLEGPTDLPAGGL